MMRRIAFLCFLGFLAATASRASPQEFDHSPWDRVLKKYVTETGRVDYVALKEGSSELDQYVAAIAARSPVSHPQIFRTRES